MSDVAQPAPTRCGFAAIVGAPNAGKSTLVNRLVGTKVAIVSPKVQTTRARVLGIAIAGPTQIVWVDTPGIFAPRRRLERAMVAAAWKGADDADIVVLLVDATRGIDADTRRIVDGLKAAGRRALLALNKIDAIRPERLLPLAAELATTGVFTETFMISARTGDGVDDLAARVAEAMPQGPWLYPEDQVADMPTRLLAAEITREQLFLQLHDELPYSTAVETETWEEHRDGSVRIGQVVYVMRPSQKAIVLGKGGQRIKAIGAAARAEITKALDRRVHLVLFVKERPGWQDEREAYEAQGIEWEPGKS
ncbi:MAG: GTPase Era [Alphaproteobacteria bacterium]|nr:GTPase Era [Alphaproteobacteria bacterium]